MNVARRAFSTTTTAFSRIGKTPISIPPSVAYSQTLDALTVTGPLGQASITLHPFITLTPSKDPAAPSLTVSIADHDEKRQRAMWGTTRTLIANAITGITEGFQVLLYLVGVGYRAAMEEDPRGTMDGGSGRRFNMKLGYSHTVYVPVPPHIQAEVPAPTKIVLKATDKHELGLFAAKVRSYRPPEPYKGKGIFIGRETMRMKAVKKK
ncbi:ribosomal protein L6 [Guyanagaster necrorhizus]|uniref:Ribosomal protein L6 n=1 Tax=Guyanagaster necrorhizus TaxID=856835 RepID=A0A9P7VMH1_9AGAR|nr:ribosomal protein L6 [Guyanagaster necrorhizus MCA 3950]KAG7443040.1 ribosomal protein L6 [Guyanagaster necrorhizus MCA 3950]